MDGFDDLDFLGLVFFLSILASIVLYALVRGFVAWIDRNSPLNRDDRRQLRTVSRGKRAMSAFKSRAVR